MIVFVFSSRRRHTRFDCDWSSDVCSSDLRRTEFGKCLINSTLTLAIVTGMGVADVSENGVALGWDEVKLPHPLFAGDTLYSESRGVETRESRSNPQRGVVPVRTQIGRASCRGRVEI